MKLKLVLYFIILSFLTISTCRDYEMGLYEQLADINISLGKDHSCVYPSNGNVWCWGKGDEGQLGMLEPLAQSQFDFMPYFPQKISLAQLEDTETYPVSAITSGENHNCLIKTETRAVACWGENFIGVFPTDNKLYLPSDLTREFKFDDMFVNIAKKESQDSAGMGNTRETIVEMQVGRTDYYSNTRILNNVKQISSKKKFTCALKYNYEDDYPQYENPLLSHDMQGNVFCWGEGGYHLGAPMIYDDDNSKKAIKNLSKIYAAIPVINTIKYQCTGQDTYDYEMIPLKDILQISVGYYHACGVKNDGTIYCWGEKQENFYDSEFVRKDGNGKIINGQEITNSVSPLGSSTINFTEKGVPIQCVNSIDSGEVPFAQKVDNITNAVKVEAGGYHSCAILADKKVRCWGLNYYGQLGDDTTKDSSTPVTIPEINDATDLALGDLYTCVLRETGHVNCWGRGYAGRLGNGIKRNDDLNFAAPVEVNGINNAVSITAGHNHTCAVLLDRHIKCWGVGGYRKLGDRDTQTQTSPVYVNSCVIPTEPTGDGIPECFANHTYPAN